MLTYLEQGYALYAILAVCLVGIAGKIAANQIYKSLIHQTENLVTASDRNLQQLKTKYESTYRMNHGVKNVTAFVEKQISQWKWKGGSLKNLENSTLYAGGFCFLLGLALSIYVYWMDKRSEWGILYLGIAVFSAAFMYYFHLLADGNGKKTLLTHSLCFYLENRLVVKTMRSMEHIREETEEARGMQDDIFMRQEDEEEEQTVRQGIRKQAGSARMRTESSRPERKQPVSQSELEALKQSLSQMAAARADGSDKSRGRKLTPREEEIIDDILEQYLS